MLILTAGLSSCVVDAYPGGYYYGYSHPYYWGGPSGMAADITEVTMVIITDIADTTMVIKADVGGGGKIACFSFFALMKFIWHDNCY